MLWLHFLTRPLARPSLPFLVCLGACVHSCGPLVMPGLTGARQWMRHSVSLIAALVRGRCFTPVVPLRKPELWQGHGVGWGGGELGLEPRLIQFRSWYGLMALRERMISDSREDEPWGLLSEC